MKNVEITWEAHFAETVEVPDDWEWDGKLDSLLEFTDMPFNHPSADLTDWGVA